MRSPDVCSNIILNVSVSVFLDEIKTRISRLGKADFPPSCGLGPSNQLNRTKRLSERVAECSQLLCSIVPIVIIIMDIHLMAGGKDCISF